MLSNWHHHVKVKVLVAQSFPTLCDPIYCSLPGSSVHEFSRQEYYALLQGIFLTQDWTWISGTVGRFFTMWATSNPLARLLMKLDNIIHFLSVSKHFFTNFFFPDLHEFFSMYSFSFPIRLLVFFLFLNLYLHLHGKHWWFLNVT